MFGITQNGEVEIIYNWERQTNEAAIRFAQLLHEIGNGGLELQMMSDLLEIPTTEKEKKFIGKTLALWAERLNSSRPAIGPLDFLGKGE